MPWLELMEPVVVAVVLMVEIQQVPVVLVLL